MHEAAAMALCACQTVISTFARNLPHFLPQKHTYMWPWSTKPDLSHTGIFVATAKNTVQVKIIDFILCQKSVGILSKVMFHEDILYISYLKYIKT